MLYPDFSVGNQTNFQNMLGNGDMWKGLTNSSLYDPVTYAFRVTDTNGTGYSDDMSAVGAMQLFLSGIIPSTGSLAITPINEAYQDYRTCFPTSEWSFNYQTKTIHIPVMAGNLSFIFGTQQVSQNFPQNGVYTVQFSSDWNMITSIDKIADINTPTLQPATLQPITRLTSQTPTVSVNQTIQPTSSPTPTQTTAPTATPLPTSQPNLQAKQTPFQTNVVILIISVAIAFAIVSAIYIKKKKPTAS